MHTYSTSCSTGIGSWYWYRYRPALKRAWSIRMLASAVRPATLQAACDASGYVFSDVLAGANRPDVTRRSLAMTIPSLARIPTQVPALLIASIAYSTCIVRKAPTGEVEEKYTRGLRK